MRQIFIVFFIFSFYAKTPAQIQVGVSTDRSIYQYGETVFITVTAFNPASDTVHLYFRSSVQALCKIDNTGIYHVPVVMYPTSASIPPNVTYTWQFVYPDFDQAGHSLLSIGSHVIYGEVSGYGISLPLNITVTVLTSLENSLSDGFSLSQNYPNPFKEVTWIPFTMVNPGRVRIDLCNFLGQNVRTILDDYFTSGSHLVRVDLHDEPSGLYWCRIEIQGKVRTLKLVLSK